MRTGIALERHRLAHGTHPETLAELVPGFLTEIPVDPCDGKPLRYRRQTDGSPLVWIAMLPERLGTGCPQTDSRQDVGAPPRINA